MEKLGVFRMIYVDKIHLSHPNVTKTQLLGGMSCNIYCEIQLARLFLAVQNRV